MKVFAIAEGIDKKTHILLFLKSKDMRTIFKTSSYGLLFSSSVLYLSIVFLRGHTPLYALEKNLLFFMMYVIAVLLIIFVKFCFDFSSFGKSVDIEEGRIIWEDRVIFEKDIKSIFFVGNTALEIYFRTEKDSVNKRFRFEHYESDFLRNIALMINSSRRIPMFKKECFLDHTSVPVKDI